ncbi:MAG: hypothetical protein JKY65_32120 [Planctomycetes bacterium]|nr:hypothetical protein [Planctomycetota bacterium]
MPRLLPIVLTLSTPFLLGLASLGCSSSGGGGGGSSATSGVTSATSSQTTTATTTPTPSTGPIANTPPPAAPPPATGGNAPIPTTSEDRYYNPHVRGTLLNYCTSCHASSSNQAALNAYELSGFPTDPMSFNNTKDRTNDLDPEASLLLQKALGNNHGGGAILKRSDVGYAWLVNWIRQGSRLDEFENAPRTFARNIQPILDRGCFGCHSGGAGGFRIGTDLQANYQQMLSVTETAVPTNSRVIQKCDGGISHTGGAPWAVGRPERDVVIQWIVDGRRFQ